MKLEVLNLETGEKENRDLDFHVSSEEIKNATHLIYLLDKYQKRLIRQGTASTKTRGEVSGGGAKPYRQKGTGRARRGSNRTPLRRGGAVVFGPKPRSHNININRKEKQKAYVAAYSSRKDDITIVNFPSDKVIKTKQVADSIISKKPVQAKNRMLFITAANEENLQKSARNLSNVNLFNVENVPIMAIVSASHIFISEDAVKLLGRGEVA